MKEKNLFQTINPKRLPEEIVKQIETLILDDELSIGSELPSERELATQLGVSRNILREAMSLLKQKGLLETKPGSGTIIVSPKIELIQDSLNFLVKFNEHALIELVEARLLIEVELAGRAALRADSDCIKTLIACCDTMKNQKDDTVAYIDADIKFHESIASAAENDVLMILLQSMHFAMHQNIQFLLDKQPGIVDLAIEYHYKLAEAIKEHDETRARELMQAHLEGLLEGIRKLSR